MAALERADAGCVHSCRRMIQPLGQIFAHAPRAGQAKRSRQQRRQAIHALADHHLDQMPQGFDEPWDQARRYLRKQGMGKHRRGSNSASGMRLLRRLEKNHDGIRSAATRPHDMQIYQAMRYRSLDIAEFRAQGPQMTGPPRV
jgi:hypothetical protein